MSGLRTFQPLTLALAPGCAGTGTPTDILHARRIKINRLQVPRFLGSRNQLKIYLFSAACRCIYGLACLPR
jgi:hypothetical protein